MATAVDAFFAQATTWVPEMLTLRGLALDAGLQETLKWKQPCYTWQGSNVAMVSAFKDYCSLSFFKGALLEDAAGILIPAGPNSRHARQARFNDLASIENHAEPLSALLQQAIALEASGARVKPVALTAEDWPEELSVILAGDAALDHAFRSLTPGRQRGYVLYIGGAKQSATRSKRVEQHRNRILKGKGIHDCVCGLSKRMPRCDGSHKHLG